jgi:hypothetical protein
MGNASSVHGDGIPFVSWKQLPHDANDANANSANSANDSSCPSSASSTPRPSRDRSVSGFSALAANVSATVGGGVATWHFAEPSCYTYANVSPRAIAAPLVWCDPPKADGELRNKHAMLGSLVVVERGGRVHFPDIIRRLLAAGAAGCVFIERSSGAATQSLFDGFHSSGRQRVAMPIVLLSKFHADQLVRDRPPRAVIEYLSGDAAIQHLVDDDQVVAVSTAARAGEVDVLKHILYADTTGSIREVLYAMGEFALGRGSRDVVFVWGAQRIHKAVALCDAAENGHVDCLEMLHGFGISLDEQKVRTTESWGSVHSWWG